MPDIGIVIVTYNSQEHIGPCLDAALRSGAEVVVVDNASSDGTAAEVVRRGARLLANRANRGFAAAVNQGLKRCRTPYVLLLNPDADSEPEVWTPCAKHAACPAWQAREENWWTPRAMRKSGLWSGNCPRPWL